MYTIIRQCAFMDSFVKVSDVRLIYTGMLYAEYLYAEYSILAIMIIVNINL